MKAQPYCILMAGGQGTRLWPASTAEMPKQFLDPFCIGRTMLQLTFDRFSSVCEPDHFVVVTNRAYFDTVRRQLPEVPADNILCEPFRRNTAPCIALASAVIRARDPEAVTIVTPTDHMVTGEHSFVDCIAEVVDFAAGNDALVAIGIRPTRADTNYGYIQCGSQADARYRSLCKVKTFTEKPNAEMAGIFIESGDFYWNAGVFVWSVRSAQMALTKFLPEIQSLFDGMSAHPTAVEIDVAYSECKNISIDYGVMEKARNVFVNICNAHWTDIGTWPAIYDYSAKDEMQNAVVGRRCSTIFYNTASTMVCVPDDKYCIVDGLNNYMVIERDNMLIICPKNEDGNLLQYASDVRAEMVERTQDER